MFRAQKNLDAEMRYAHKFTSDGLQSFGMKAPTVHTIAPKGPVVKQAHLK